MRIRYIFLLLMGRFCRLLMWSTKCIASTKLSALMKAIRHGINATWWASCISSQVLYSSFRLVKKKELLPTPEIDLIQWRQRLNWSSQIAHCEMPIVHGTCIVPNVELTMKRCWWYSYHVTLCLWWYAFEDLCQENRFLISNRESTSHLKEASNAQPECPGSCFVHISNTTHWFSDYHTQLVFGSKSI